MKTSCGKFLNLAHYYPYDVKLRLLAHSRSFLANKKATNAIVGAENLLIVTITVSVIAPFLINSVLKFYFEQSVVSQKEISALSQISSLSRIKITISSIVIGLKNSYFPLIHLPSYYRRVCYWAVCYRTVQ